MSSEVNRLRRFGPLGRVGRGSGAKERTDLPPDHQLTFCPAFDEKWTFKEERKICLNDVDVQEMVHDGANDVRLLCGVFQGLHEYQQDIWKRGGKAFEKFNAIVESLQGTISGRLGCIYDGLTGGIRFECNGDDFWINNINVRTVIVLYRLKPTDKARRYLMGIRDKLGLILSRNSNSTRYDGVHEQAMRYFEEISLAIEYIPADAPLCLMAGSRSP